MNMPFIQQKHLKALRKFGLCCCNLVITEELPAGKIIVGARIHFQHRDPETRHTTYYDLRVCSVQEAEDDPKSRDVVLAPDLEPHRSLAPG